MKKFLLFFTGILFFTPWLTPTVQADFCSVFDKEKTIYRQVYCDGIQQDEDDLFEVVAQQFGINDSDTVGDILNGEIDAEALPNSLKSYTTTNADRAKLIATVQTAYDKEKVIHHMKASFKQEFSADEKWFNASSADSSFDLVVDLNIIEKILFGSQAEWQDDVYSFPSADDDQSSSGNDESASDSNSNATSEDEEEFATGSGSGNATPPLTDDDELECLPADHPDADVPAKEDGPGAIPALCGNNQLNPGEQCDDGNNQSGDGCAANCQLEDIGSLQCFDPDAVSFENFEPDENEGEMDSEDGDAHSPFESTQECPPGTYPPKPGSPTALASLPTVPQSSKYPGPFVGGVLKNFKAVNQPPCPIGESEVMIESFGEKASACVPTALCADFDEARDHLFGPGWEDDPDTSRIAGSIEALFCVELIAENRPESPYELNEGCIDCHIRGMVDTMEELLASNVEPLENTQNAFAISNRWGPNVSFNLNTAVKPKTRLSDLAKKVSAIDEANEAKSKARQKRALQLDGNNTIAQPSSPHKAHLSEIVSNYTDFQEKQDKAYFSSLKNYRLNALTDDQIQFGGRVLPLLNQWKESFERIQDAYSGIVQTSDWRDKQECTF